MKLFKLLLCIILLNMFAHAAHAAPLSQAEGKDGQVYIVQSGDWLMNIAQSSYGDTMRYTDIVAATNNKAQADASFATISNPDFICAGQKLWIPLAKDASADEEPSAEASTDEAISIDEISVDETSVDEVSDEAPADEYSLAMTDETSSTATFVVLGDMPYSEEEDIALTAPNGAFVQAIQAIDPPVVVHYGDLKGGGEDCTDSILAERQAQIAALHPNRIAFTPGDNDWTDCDRDFLENRFDELERLNFLRTLFYEGEGLEMTQGIPDLVRQEGLPENAMWPINNLMMGTIHLVGTNNGRREILIGDVEATLDAVDERDALNLAWLTQLFESANEADGLAVIFQADIYRPEDLLPPCTPDNRSNCDGYHEIRDAIEAMSLSYGKPVLVIHGSTNAYCFNQPSEEATNLWHFNGPGDFKVLDVAQVSFNPSESKPFSAVTLVEGITPPEVCDYSR